MIVREESSAAEATVDPLSEDPAIWINNHLTREWWPIALTENEQITHKTEIRKRDSLGAGVQGRVGCVAGRYACHDTHHRHGRPIEIDVAEAGVLGCNQGWGCEWLYENRVRHEGTDTGVCQPERIRRAKVSDRTPAEDAEGIRTCPDARGIEQGADRLRGREPGTGFHWRDGADESA